MKEYFIADPHLGHENILALDNRRFKDIEEHDKTFIANCNKTLNSDDKLYIIGDLSWHNYNKTIQLLRQINCKKHLIVGNHDHDLLKNKQIWNEFEDVCDYKEIEDNEGRHIVLCHYPIPCFKNHYYGWYHLYGHVHNSFEWNMMLQLKWQMTALYDKKCNMYNVGAMLDYMNLTPRTLDYIINACGDKY